MVSLVVDTSQLIEMVEQRPCLWDNSLVEFRDKGAKERAWNEICASLVPQYNGAKSTDKTQICSRIIKKWYNVRDSYVKSKRDSYKRRKRKYIYTDKLGFLDAFTKGNLCNDFDDHKSSDDETEDTWKTEFIEMEDENLNDSKAMIIEADPSPAKKFRLPIPEANKEDSLMLDNYKDNIIGILAGVLQKEEDEDRAFFNSITPAVKNLSEDLKYEFRAKVLKVLNDLRLKNKNDGTIRDVFECEVDSE